MKYLNYLTLCAFALLLVFSEAGYTAPALTENLTSYTQAEALT